MNIVNLQENILNLNEINDLVHDSDCNPAFLYIERFKNISQSAENKINSNHLKAFFNNICLEIRNKWNNIKNIIINKKVGLINYNEISMVIAISCSYLSDATDAVVFAVNKIKSFKALQQSEIFSTRYANNQEDIFGRVTEKLSERDLIEIDDVPPDLIQIKANNYEINKRIENFILLKRTALNDRNIKEFAHVNSKTPSCSDDGHCARVDAVLWKRSDSKSHLKVHKVINEWGPQVSNTLTETAASSKMKNHNLDIPKSIEERLMNCERHVGVDRPVSGDIYARLKHIEDRILELDSISPEYSNFWNNSLNLNQKQNEPVSNNNKKRSKKRTYSLEDLKNKLAKYKKEMQSS